MTPNDTTPEMPDLSRVSRERRGLVHAGVGAERRKQAIPRWHRDGRPTSDALKELAALAPNWAGLPVDEHGRIGRGIGLVSLVEAFVDPALAGWVEGLEPILPGEFYVLPRTSIDRCDVLYVTDAIDHEVVLSIEVDAYGTLDVVASYPRLDLYLGYWLGDSPWPPGADEAHDALLASVRQRLFDGRASLFEWTA